MEVQIKGFSMPDSCVDCKMAYDGSYCILVEDDNDAIESGKMWRRCPLLKRPNWCPLEEVRHGEWIDDPNGSTWVNGEKMPIKVCSVCGNANPFNALGDPYYPVRCDRCGARLYGKGMTPEEAIGVKNEREKV